jgi:hypothetical protein
VAGEAAQHAMMATHIPASDEELDRWLVTAREAEQVAALGGLPLAVQRLVSEVILLRSLAKTERTQADEARASARAEGYKHQRAEGTRDRLAAELGEALSREAALKARVEQLEAALRTASRSTP